MIIISYYIILYHITLKGDATRPTVGAHTFNSHSFKSRASNLGTIAYLHFRMPSVSSTLPGSKKVYN